MTPKPKSISSRLIETLGGLRLSFILLVLLGLLIGQRAIIAQKAVSPEDAPWIVRALNAIGLESAGDLDIPFLIVLGLFLVNLAFSSVRMAEKVRVKQRRSQASRGGAAILALPAHVELTAQENPEQGIDHHIPNQMCRAGATLRLQILHPGGFRHEQMLREAVD